MELVIDLPKEAYDLITGKTDFANIDLYSTLIQAVQKGTSLSRRRVPKTHGKLVDIDEFLEDYCSKEPSYLSQADALMFYNKACKFEILPATSDYMDKHYESILDMKEEQK